LVTHSDHRAPVQADLDVGLQLLRCLFSSCHKDLILCRCSTCQKNTFHTEKVACCAKSIASR
jgi:hypothetical protein